MDKELLKKAFREYKKAAGLAYAITSPDNLGSDMSNVNFSLCEKYGEDSKGIWAKNWQKGCNARPSVERAESMTVAHDLTPEQAETFYKVMGQYYNITPSAYDRWTCFTLYEKDVKVYEYNVTMKAEWSWHGREEHRHSIHTDKGKFMARELKYLAEHFMDEDCGIKSFSFERIF